MRKYVEAIFELAVRIDKSQPRPGMPGDNKSADAATALLAAMTVRDLEFGIDYCYAKACQAEDDLRSHVAGLWEAVREWYIDERESR